MSVTEFKRLTTIGEVARRLNRPQHRVEYVVRARRLQPAKRAGNARVFSDADVQYIESELSRIDADRNGGGPSRG